jgi:hypothetical protein
MAATESLLLAGLLFLAAYELWVFFSLEGAQESTWLGAMAERLPEYTSLEVLLAVLLCFLLYWVLQRWVNSSFAFWSMALLIIVSQGPVIWTYNRLQWSYFWGMQPSIEAPYHIVWQCSLFFASLIGLVALYRVIGLRKLDGQLRSQSTDHADRRRVMLSEVWMLMGLIGAGLILATLMVVCAAALGQLDSLLDQSSWRVLAIGGGASLLLILSLAFSFRSHESHEATTPEHTEQPGVQPR